LVKLEQNTFPKQPSQIAQVVARVSKSNSKSRRASKPNFWAPTVAQSSPIGSFKPIWQRYVWLAIERIRLGTSSWLSAESKHN